MLQIVASYHCMKFQRKLMNQTWENRKKPYFNPFGPKIFRIHSKLSLYTISRKTNEPTMRNWKKENLFWPIWSKFGPTNFFSKNIASLVARCHGQLSSSTISEKTNDPILRKLSDGRTDGREWFHRMLSD